MQRKADADAEARSNQATASFGQALNRLAPGDLRCEIEQPLTAQFEALRVNVNLSTRQLRSALILVEGAVTAMESGTSELHSGSNEHSRRTGQQAASLEETVATLGQITSNVNDTAHWASQARSADGTTILLGNPGDGKGVAAVPVRRSRRGSVPVLSIDHFHMSATEAAGKSR